MRKTLLAATLAAFTLLFSMNLFATQVTIDPGGYAEQWHITTTAGSGLKGPQIIDLDSGTYNIVLAGESSSRFTFHISDNGAVTSDNAAAAVGGQNTLTFNNTSLTVDPVGFSGSWRINRTTPYLTLQQGIVVVPGLRYSMLIGGERYSDSGITFHVAGDGIVTSDNTAAAIGGQNTLTFNNTSLTVDPVGYSGSWRINGATPQRLTGLQQGIIVVPGLRYSMFVGGASFGKNKLKFHVAGDGVVTSDNAAAAAGGQNTLTFNNISLTVDPVNYSGSWYITLVAPYLTGLQQGIVVVPGLGYSMRVGRSNITFYVAGDGFVTSDNADAAEGGLKWLTFNNTQISVSPIDYTGNWSIKGVISYPHVDGYVHNSITGDHSVILVPGLGYQFQDISGGNYATIAIAEPCAVSPNELTFPSGDISFSCGEPDSDNDGTPDTLDNCTNDPNSDQKDTDRDNVGDICDYDIDGDTIANGADNCPLDINTDQADNDADGFGDVCDDDVDGDLVTDTIDNCPQLANIDQADNDADGFGDVCDQDDDNDSIGDENDNCPLDSNIGQADDDGNGEGNACDGDIDGDSVANLNDQCTNTSSNTIINSYGCNAAQFIELSCDRASFANHGRYVSCVAKAANDAVNDELLLENKKSDFIKQAAKK